VLCELAATLVVFILPFIIFRLVAMAGNWVQHAFVSADQPENPYQNSVTCINVKFNHKCWNDGYHISHHIDPTMHWTDHPAFFLDHVDEFARHAPWCSRPQLPEHIRHAHAGRYDLLAQHFVNVGDVHRNDEEVMVFLRSRASPVPFSTVKPDAVAAMAMA